jgi:hypothetical protein
MEWLPLKMNFLPLIFHEINNVTEEYISLLSRLQQKEKGNPKDENIQNNNNKRSINKNIKSQEESENEEEENNKEKDITEEDEFQIAIKKYNTLRESISKRINELETFYEDNIEDIRVSNFEKARLRLKKLLMYSYENLTKIENSSQQHNIFIKDSNIIFNKKITEDTKKKILENNISLEKQITKEKNKEEEKAKKKLMSLDEKQKKYLSKNELNKKKVIKVRGDEGFLRPMDKNRRSGLSKEGEKNFDMDYDDYSRYKEIVFKIKLNQDEYKLFLKEKKNKGNVSPYLFK